ncbi:uncharacterized protein LOC141524021 [Cotesia typhae]|uniref:uncharacterized protein LOC141524021 n=1 Tax=Cotesia typhae TaxID=2053667 RepID=UPI003D68CC24
MRPVRYGQRTNIRRRNISFTGSSKEAVRACFQAAKVKNKKQRRYTIEWVYECLMVLIKGPAVYEKLRTRQILPLPCTLLLDEIALSEAVKLNTKSMEFNGFVNLGEYTPDSLINERADHALVFMFQPFQVG